MHRIDHLTADPNKNGPGLAGWTEGAPPLVPPTQGTEAWFNDVQENIASVVTSAGLKLEKGSFKQLSQAQSRLGASTALSSWRDTGENGWGRLCATKDALIVANPGTTRVTLDGISFVDRSAVVSASNMILGRACSGTRVLVGFHVVGAFSGIARSDDNGASWTATEFDSATRANAIAYSEELGVFVVAGATSGAWVLTTSDGIVFTPRSPGSAAGLYGCTRSDRIGLFVAVGYAGTIITSPNGVDWTVRSSGTVLHLHDVSTDDERFVAVGEHGVVLSSEDGIEWTPRASGTLQSLYAVRGTPTAGFVAAGNAGMVITSLDAVMWTRRYVSSPFGFVSIEWFRGQCFLLGGDLFVSLGSAA